MKAPCDVDLFDVLTLNFPCQRFSEASKTDDSIADHRFKTAETRIWRKSICYDGLAIKKIAGCLKMWR